MKHLIFYALLLSLGGCALTAPNGTKELMEDIAKDRATNLKSDRSFDGRPIFVKVRAYPQFQNGHVYGKQWILMRVGREQLDIEQMTKELSE